MWLPTWEHMCTKQHTCMYVDNVYVGSLSLSLSILHTEAESLTDLEAHVLASLASLFQGSSFHLPSAGITGGLPGRLALTWVLGLWILILTLEWQVFYCLSHLHSCVPQPHLLSPPPPWFRCRHFWISVIIPTLTHYLFASILKFPNIGKRKLVWLKLKAAHVYGTKHQPSERSPTAQQNNSRLTFSTCDPFSHRLLTGFTVLGWMQTVLLNV